MILRRLSILKMNHLINPSNLPFDIRAEVLGRLLGEKYELGWEQILLRPTKHFQRLGRRDVIGISDGFSMRIDKEQVWLEISREGIADVLPEELFGYSDGNPSDEQITAGRKFCLPFEQLFYWLRLENEQRESRFEKHIEQQWWDQFLSEEYDGYSPLSELSLDEKQKHVLFAMLPILSDIIGNWQLTEEWLSLFMDTPIRISEIPPPEYSLPESVQKRLGDLSLGQDFIIGSSFCDGIPNIKILIDGLTADTIGDYLLDGEKRTLLEEILTMMLPVEIPFQVELTLKEQSNYFQVGESYPNAVLGFTTVL